MNPNILKIVLSSATGLFFLAAVVSNFEKNQFQVDEPGFIVLPQKIEIIAKKHKESTENEANVLKAWKVTMLDGRIKKKLVGPAVQFLCEDFTEYIFRPVLDEEKTFVRLIYRKKKPHLKGIPKEVYDTLVDTDYSVQDLVEDEDGLFLFQFGFDNGHHSNKILDGYGEQFHLTELIKGLWSFEVGYWTNEGVRGESISGTKWGGKSSFLVVGRFVDEGKIEGQWSFEAIETLPGTKNCVTKAEGYGNWIAVKK